MQFKNIVLTGFLGLAAAASSDSSSDLTSLAAELPTCSLSCLMNGAAAVDCGSTDFTCQCENQEAISINATSCLTSSCSVTDITTTESVVSQICDIASGNGTATSSNSTATGTSSSSSASSTSTNGLSAGSRTELYGLCYAAVAGVVGLLAL